MHCVDRYGLEEVAKWYFQTWNEPHYPAYWFGTPGEFHQLHDHALHGVRRALPGARVGGPHTAGDGGEYMDDFLKHVVSGTNHATAGTGTPTDLVAFHAKGRATFLDGHFRIDGEYSSAYARWQRMGEPVVLNEEEYADVERAGKLQTLEPRRPVPLSAGRAQLEFVLPRQAVSLVALDLEGP